MKDLMRSLAELQCGIDIGAAREKVRVAHALVKLPRIAAAMSRGELSYSKARALTRVACENTEEYFLSIALHGTAAHVEKLVRGYRRAKESEELSREAQQQATRQVSHCYDADGSLILKARLPAEMGALVLKALEAAMNDVSTETSVSQTDEKRPSWGARRADALGRVAESFLQHGAEALNGGLARRKNGLWAWSGSSAAALPPAPSSFRGNAVMNLSR